MVRLQILSQKKADTLIISFASTVHLTQITRIRHYYILKEVSNPVSKTKLNPCKGVNTNRKSRFR